MKKILLSLLFVSLAGFMFSQAWSVNNFQKDLLNGKGLRSENFTQNGFKGTGVTNADFENWNNTLGAYGLGEMPNGFIHIDGNVDGHKSTTPQNGTYAIHVESNMAMYAALGETEETLHGGMAFAGALVGSTLAQGEPYTDHLVSVDGYIRGSLLSNDTALFIVETYLGGATPTAVAAGMLMWGPADVTTTWTAFNLVLEYEEGAPAPDSINIFLTSTGVGIFNGFDIGTLTAGSYVEFDNFTYNVEVPTTPVASMSPGSWNAGNVYLTENSTSDMFTLTNTGTGTLTVSDATALTAPWSTTFDAGSVSLENGEQYTFSFNFAPTVLGAAAESFVLTTTGGNVTISLSGNGIQAPTGDMDGGFETNVNDFDLAFEGWVQYDNDLSATYTIQDVAFTNDGYTGSFIAFNPTTTTPALGTEWAAFEGNRYGVCFAATTPANNDWLITPQSDVLLNNATLTAQVQSITDQYGLERYAIWISTTDDQAASFTKISAGDYVQAPTAGWAAISYPLSDYAGDQVYIGIQCVSSDAFAFMVDNINIDLGTAVNSNVAAAVSVYPNPANDVITVANAENANIVIVNMIGEVVANVNNASSNQTIDISNLANGTYFVKVDGNVFKINVVK